jgi:hypothetical protein
MTKWIAALGISAALAVAAPDSADAQGPVITGGLVNVTLVDVLNNNNIAVLNNVGIGVAANVAAQICGTQVALPANIIGVLVAQVAATGQATACTITDQSGVVRQVQISKQQQ